MTSYQARLKEIRELKREIQILNQQKHELAQQDVENRIKQYTQPPPRDILHSFPPPLRTTGEIFPLIEKEEEKPIFPSARKWLIAFAIFGMVALLGGYWLHIPNATMVGIVFIIGIIAAGSVLLVFDKEIDKKPQ